MMKIWFVDDHAKNRQMWLNSFPKQVKKENEFKTFATVEALISNLEAGEQPHIIFLDFFIKDRYGFEVIEYFDKKEGDRPCLIAHSSLKEANQGMLGNGADFIFQKVPGMEVTQSLVDAIRSSHNLQQLFNASRSNTSKEQ